MTDVSIIHTLFIIVNMITSKYLPYIDIYTPIYLHIDICILQYRLI